jgi:uncharacterized protein YcbK (DUF882 family)
MIDQELICKLNQLKEKHPCSTESLDRTPYHNASVGGAKGSYHVKGQAVDLIFDQPSELLPAALYAKTLGFGGIELDYRNLHLHLDLRTDMWHVVCTPKETVPLEAYLTLHPIPV